MILKVKNEWNYEDAYSFVVASKVHEKIFDELYPVDEVDTLDLDSDEEPDLLDRVNRYAGDSGDGSVIEAILKKTEGSFFVVFVPAPVDDGYYTIYQFE